jgi:GntR family transcriptional regulator / MocR family aminotransferase
MMNKKTDLQFDLDGSKATPIYIQIYRSVSQAVLEGRLKSGTRLPSARSLAAQLGVARGTVETAYHQLAGEGYIVTRGAAGTRVSKTLKRTLLQPSGKLVNHNESTLETVPSTAEPALLQMGLPALDLFPHSLWSRLLSQQARDLGSGDLSHPNPMGLETLRIQVAAYLAVARGIVCSPAEVIITGGYQGALGLITRCLLNPGDRVWLEDPCYPDSRDAIGWGEGGWHSRGSQWLALAGCDLETSSGTNRHGHADTSVSDRRDALALTAHDALELGR